MSHRLALVALLAAASSYCTACSPMLESAGLTLGCMHCSSLKATATQFKYWAQLVTANVSGNC